MNLSTPRRLRFGLLSFVTVVAATAAEPWRAGVATRKLTPPGPIWLAGYANRTAPSDGVDTDLFGTTLYIREKPSCPANGTYTLGVVSDKPVCTTAGHTI